MSCANISYHDGTTHAQDAMNSSLNPHKNGNKDTTSLNHFLSHNVTKEYSEQSQIQDEFASSKNACNKSGLLGIGAENLS
jgi:hypothetical protein